MDRARDAAAERDGLSLLREWLATFAAHVRAVDFESARLMCAPEMVAFGTVAYLVEGIDRVMEQQWRHVWPHIRDFTIRAEECRGAVDGDRAWAAVPWDSLGVGPDGHTFPRRGRFTVVLERRDDRWLAVHTHVSLAPERPGP